MIFEPRMINTSVVLIDGGEWNEGSITTIDCGEWDDPAMFPLYDCGTWQLTTVFDTLLPATEKVNANVADILVDLNNLFGGILLVGTVDGGEVT